MLTTTDVGSVTQGPQVVNMQRNTAEVSRKCKKPMFCQKHMFFHSGSGLFMGRAVYVLTGDITVSATAVTAVLALQGGRWRRKTV